ncbi:MarR family winged helix-turn-helix transcriptional regulator [Jiangella sp. DSM 45060]|uniref:MarR family winged helix-turn-helix transcriptional regulator n=1 Tax=Jiangella sp. DSM 45060 TaxID=1798224 RepID=UPI00087CCA47|nr:MarR family transcriptional regulator [Jiangella sp. DSM 45060]SDT42725.1 DNA-binding transcriptional regulator, MarR family [Jiangella sp. DSM 45060]
MTTTQGIEDDLGWRLGVLFRAYVQSADAATAGIPGDHRGRQVLAVAVREEPRTQSALAQRLGIDKTVLTYLLDALTEAGLVERQPDPADRRSRRVVATERGREYLAEADRRVRLTEEHVLAGLDDADRTALRELLGRLAARLHAADPVADPCRMMQEIGDRG